MPPVSRQDEDADYDPAPRRTTFYSARSTWWRPRTSFGRILLGTGVFIALAGLTGAGFLTRRFLVHDNHFRIPGASSIQSTGLSEVSRAELLPVFGEDIGRNIFFVPLGERRKQLEAIPWVKEATVMRFLPDHLSVSIVERTPVAFVRQGSQVELADADGVILSMPPSMMAQHHYSFPVITGIDARDSLASRRARMAVYQRFLAELDQDHQHRTDQVSEIDLSDPEDLRATMPEQGSDILAHFGEDHFLERLGVYKAHVAEWRQRYPRLIGVDLRYSGEVPLEMASDQPGIVPAKITVLHSASPAAPKVVAASAPAKPKPAPAKAPAPLEKKKAVTPPQLAAQHKAAEARKKAAKLKAEKAKAAQAKASKHKPTAPASTRQGQ
jgi:cell division protein FtsQ